MSALFCRLFGSDQPSLEAEHDQGQTQLYTAPAIEHPPIVQLPERSRPRKKTKATHRSKQGQDSIVLDQSKHDNVPAKRHANQYHNDQSGHKRRKFYDNSPFLTLECGDQTEDGFASYSESKKRRRAVSIDGELKLTKRPKPSLDTERGTISSGKPYAEAATVVDEKEELATPTASNREDEVNSLHGTSPKLLPSGCAIDVMTSSAFTPWWKDLVNQSQRPNRKTADNFSSSKAQAYLRAKQVEESDEITNPTANCPSGLLFGVRLWAGSNIVPGKCTWRTDGKDFVQHLMPRLCSSQAKPHENNPLMDELELPPLFRVHGKTENDLFVPTTNGLKAKKTAKGSRQSRLSGLWNGSVGSPMGPTEWTG